MASPSKVTDWLTVVVAVLALLVSLYIEMTHTDAEDHAKAMANEHRITAVEQKQADDSQKIDHIGAQVDKLVDWMIGSK